MKEESLGTAVNAISRLTGEFRLRSGQVSTEYFDKYRFEANPLLLRRIAIRMLELISTDTEILAGLELGGVPIATAMSLESGLPVVFVRKAAKEYGTCQAVEGGDVSDRKITIIEDVITTGGAVADATQQLRAAGALVTDVVCAIWRGEGEPRILGIPDLKVVPALRLADLV